MANHSSNEKLYVRSEKAQILIHKRVRFCLEVLIFSIKFIYFIKIVSFLENNFQFFKNCNN